MSKNKLLSTVFCCVAAALLLSASASAQNAAGRSVSGTVLDKQSAPVIGAGVLVKGTQNGAVTSLDGTFTLKGVKEGDILEVSSLGFETREIKVTDSDKYRILLNEDTHSLEEVVVVGYGTQKRVTLSGSVAAVGGDEIVKSKNENVENMLTGRLPGLRVVQQSAEPGAFKTSFSVRGMGTPLIIIDGVPRDNIARLDANDIESISVLKDASAAIYGVKAANGVVLITTKSGKDTEGKINLSYSGNFTWQYTAGLPKTINAVELMQLENEKVLNQDEGSSWRYTQEEIDAYLNGEKQSTDWYNAVVRNGAPQYSHNINISGGTKKTQYFASLGYQYQDSFFKSGDFNYDRYNMRVNLTTKITDNLTFGAKMSGIMDTKNASSESAHNIIYAMWRSFPTVSIFENGHEGYYTRGDNKDNPVQLMQSEQVGYNKIDKKWIQTSANIKWDIPFIEGLNAKAEVSYDYSCTNTKIFTKAYNYYTYQPDTEEYVATTLNSPSQLKREFADNNVLMYQFSLNYDRTFADTHHIGANLISESIHRKGDGFYASRELSIDVDELFAGNTLNQVGSMSPDDRYEYANQSYIGRLNYDYKSKYMLEATFRVDGSSRFPSNSRWGLFPSVSVGYRISEENFWKNSPVLSVINNFKIRASYGKMGDDGALDYQFLSGYTYPAYVKDHNDKDMAGGYIFDGVYVNGVETTGIPNKNITWYEAETKNIGIDAEAWHGLLGVSFDVFQRDRSGLLATSNTILPGTVGAALPQENLNADRNMGYEIEVSHRNTVGELYYGVSANMALARSMTQFRQHADYRSARDEWKNSTSYRYKDIWWGKGAGGQYSSWDEIATFPVHTGRSLTPGDYYYEDWNGDGFIDSDDEHPIGYDCDPLLSFAFNFDFSWRGFDLNMLFQGAGMTSVEYTGILGSPLADGKSTPITMFMDRWHMVDPSANPHDQFTEWIPGKFAMTGSSKREETSAMNMYDGTYLRLKNIELGYTIPAKLTKKVAISNLRFYVNAYNLLTFSKLDFVDPEHPSSDSYMYPHNRTWSLGVNCKF